jgi:hypothetical protein
VAPASSLTYRYTPKTSDLAGPTLGGTFRPFGIEAGGLATGMYVSTSRENPDSKPMVAVNQRKSSAYAQKEIALRNASKLGLAALVIQSAWRGREVRLHLTQQMGLGGDWMWGLDQLKQMNNNNQAAPALLNGAPEVVPMRRYSRRAYSDSLRRLKTATAGPRTSVQRAMNPKASHRPVPYDYASKSARREKSCVGLIMSARADMIML